MNVGELFTLPFTPVNSYAAACGGTLLFALGASLLGLIASLPLSFLSARFMRNSSVLTRVITAFGFIPVPAWMALLLPGQERWAGFFALLSLTLGTISPIWKKSYAALNDLPAPLMETASACGMSRGARLCRLELPIIAPALLAGFRRAIVMSLGWSLFLPVFGYAPGLDGLLFAALKAHRPMIAFTAAALLLVLSVLLCALIALWRRKLEKSHWRGGLAW